jgi:hypothetical protein
MSRGAAPELKKLQHQWRDYVPSGRPQAHQIEPKRGRSATKYEKRSPAEMAGRRAGQGIYWESEPSCVRRVSIGSIMIL